MVWAVGLGTADDAVMQDALLQKLAERQPGYYGSAEPVRPAGPPLTSVTDWLPCLAGVTEVSLLDRRPAPGARRRAWCAP